jgi:homoserine/homoserine lactone efflux protein
MTLEIWIIYVAIITFFASLFPQCIDPNSGFVPQFIILSATYIILDGVFLFIYGIGASWVAEKFRGAAKNRSSALAEPS